MTEEEIRKYNESTSKYKYGERVFVYIPDRYWRECTVNELSDHLIGVLDENDKQWSIGIETGMIFKKKAIGYIYEVEAQTIECRDESLGLFTRRVDAIKFLRTMRRFNNNSYYDKFIITKRLLFGAK